MKMHLFSLAAWLQRKQEIEGQAPRKFFLRSHVLQLQWCSRQPQFRRKLRLLPVLYRQLEPLL
jgi:hypothetical protein